MHILSLILVFFLFASLLVSGRKCDPTDPLIKFMRELKNARQECASLLGDETTRTVTTTTSVDSPPTTFFTEIDHETTISSLDVARLTKTVMKTETKTVTSAVYNATSYSTVFVTVTSVPSPRARTSTVFQTSTAGGITTYYTIMITSFRTTTTAATSEVLLTTYVTSIVTVTLNSSLVTSPKTSLAATLPDYSTETITATSLLPSTPLASIKSTTTTIIGSNITTTISDYSTETITATYLLSYTPPKYPTSIRNGSTPTFSATITPSSPLKSTKPIITPSTGRNFTSTPPWNNATGTSRASSLLSSPGLGSYTTETRTAASLLSSSPSASPPFSTDIPSTFISPITSPSAPTTFFISTSNGPSVPLSPGCTEYTTTITKSDLLPRTSTPVSTFTTLGSIYNTSISTKETHYSAPLTPSSFPSPSPSPSPGPGPVMNRWKRFNIPKSSFTTPSTPWHDAIVTAAPVIPENGLDTVRLYDRHPGDTSSACSCIMPYLLSQPKVTVVVTDTIPPRMIRVTKTKVFTKVHIDGTTTLTSSIIQHTTKHVTLFHTKTKKEITTKSVATPGITQSTPVVTVTSTTTVQAPVTSTGKYLSV